ncbi:unnamed protein product [Ceutorhynchus assimilis]|uniref:chitinase n=1 Tax=Ceutorhynchus assimilis TaxID=467358 RepID=A0A9P0DL12_9CUCU|nr:unnamed protein product [Ceutorhynchus assimilis]
MISTGICRWLFLLISLSTWIKVTDSKEMRIVCYYTNWSVYRPGQAKFSPQNINPYLCTHLIYAFGGFTKENTLKPFDKYQDIEKGGYAKFIGLKTYNKNLKTLIAIGGWNEGSSRFSPMVASADRRKQLVKNAIKFLRQNHFDGLDLDWEYPTFRDGGKSRDRDNYAQLVKELREEFERESEKTGRPRLLLTMAVPAGIEYINKGYDVPKLTKYLDWMNILSYDYHSAFEPAVNHHAPLYALEEENEYNYDTELNIDYTIKHYLKLGADPSKLVLGIPTYGRSYTLFNPDAYEIGSPADGPGDMGDATRENGYLAYYEICENVKNQEWEVDEPNSEAMGPIAFKDNQWVGYDDENIVRKKAKYVAENALGGIMFWAIDNDDFRGNCHGKPYPLIEAGKEALLNAYGLTEENLISPPSKPTKSSKTKSRTRSSKRTTTTTEIPEEEDDEVEVSSAASRRRRIKTKTQKEEIKRQKSRGSTSTYSSLKVITPAYTTPEPPATPDMGGSFKCEDEGFFPNPKDCKKYFWCLGGPGDTGIVAHSFTCPAGLYFNKGADSCDYSQNVLCNKKIQKATATTTEATSEKPTASSLFSTTRVPPKITAATSKTTLNFRTTTTTEIPEDDFEYVDDEEDDAQSRKEESEEDPRVIKELIMLIRKAGGIEELEKQITNTKDVSSDSTTPSAISKSLYESLLSKTSKNTLKALRKTTGNRNSGGPQTSIKETKTETVDRGRPQYKTLNRQRSPTSKTTENEEEKEVEKDKVKENKSLRTKSSLEYVNIRRPKASTTTEASDDDGFSRNKILGEVDTEDENENPDEVTKKNNHPQYVNIRRQRPSTTEASETSSKYSSIRRSTTDSSIDAVGDEDNQKQINRRGSTTETSATGNEVSSLRYQTIRRGTTTASTTLVDEDIGEETIRKRSTTSSPTSDTVESKYSSIRRSTTASPVEEEKSTTIRVDPTTVSLIETSEDLKTTMNSESSTENDLPETTVQQLSNNNSITTESLVSSTNKITTESNSGSTSGTLSSTVKKRPVLFQPRPFGISTTTTEIPVNTKVSQSSFKFRLSQNTSTESPTTTTVRSRSRVRYSNVNRNLNEDTEQEEKYERTIENKPVRARKRLLVSTTAETYVDANEEYNRKYRPAELADLSSLTAVDLKQSQFISKNRRRRPVGAGSATSTTEKSLDESEKTGSRTLTLARKAIDVTAFGRTRRVLPTNDDQLKDSTQQGSDTTKIVRGFRSSSPRPKLDDSTDSTPKNDSVKVTPRTRRIIRKFRPGAGTTASTEENRVSSTTEIVRRRVPSFRQRQIKNVTASPLETNSSESPLLNLFKGRSRFELAKNNANDEDDDVDESSTEYTGVLNAEEGENIKLSESNIRESSQINTFEFDDKPGKRKFDKSSLSIEEKTTSESTDYEATTTQAPTSTENSRILRTRKIIRKFSTTTATSETNSSDTTTENITGRRRIIHRRLRPSNANDLYKSEEKDEQTKNEEVGGASSRKPFRPSFVRATTERANVNEEIISGEPSVDDQEEIVEEIKPRKNFRPSFARKNTETTKTNDDVDVEEEIREQTKSQRIFRPSFGRQTTERTEISEEEKVEPNKFKILMISEDEENENHETDDDDEIDEPNYTIYTTSSVQRMHKYESNTNFNDEDEEDVDKSMIANNSVSSLTLTSAVNNRQESETILDDEKDLDEVQEKEAVTRKNNLLKPQKDRPSYKQRFASSKEEIQTKSQEDSIKTLPGYRLRSTTSSTADSDGPEIITSENDITTTENIDAVTENNEILTTTMDQQETTVENVDEEATTISKDDVTILTDLETATDSPVYEISPSSTETTTEYRRRSTLRSFRERPRFLTRATTEAVSSSSTESGSSTRKPLTRAFGKNRYKKPTTVSEIIRSTSPLPLNKLLYRYSTTERIRFVEKNLDDDDDEEVDDENYEDDEQELIDATSEKFKLSYSASSTTPRTINKPIDTRKFKKPINKPKFTKPTTESIPSEDLGFDTEAVKNRNKNLFSKRKMNTPAVVLTSTNPSDETPDSTDPSLTTLHHIFAEIQDGNTATEPMISSSPSTANTGKLERLIEVNRIVQVKTENNNTSNKIEIIPTIDKIGEISRITLIKIVDGNKETVIENPDLNEINSVLEQMSSPVYIKSENVAKVEEIPPSKALNDVTFVNPNFNIKIESGAKDLRKERKFEIFGESKVANSKELTNPAGKPEIIDGISHINVVTPKPLLVTEASTISLQGLFQTEKPNLNPSFTTNDEVLETGRSEFVNVRVLDQDTNVRLDKELKGAGRFIPVRILMDEEEETTVKAHVMEISPKPDSRTIKIVPIKVEMSRNVANFRVSDVKT